jgi:2,4-dienoyl-CoA reductase-like NADH-dependent reductase (Old Yellow Enzyme family)
MANVHDPLTFPNGAKAKNRIWLAPLTNKQSHADGTLSDDELRFLRMRAEGGFGIVETCASHVAKDGQGWDGELGNFGDEHLPGLTKLATTLKGAGALALTQLFHGGVRADSRLTGERTWSASEFTEDKPGFVPPRAATEADIERVLGQFVAAAKRAETAGFDGIELHGAHGYLLSQFLSKTMNLRSDAWGGSLEGRARLVREAMRRVRAATAKSFVVGVRLSPEDYFQARGLDLDETIQVAQWLCEDGASFIHLSLWTADKNTKKYPDKHALPLFRAALPREVPIVAAGSIWTLADAQALLDRGADAVALGKSAILNPDWADRSREASWEPKRPPVTIAELRERGLNAEFAEYMRNWKGFVEG